MIPFSCYFLAATLAFTQMIVFGAASVWGGNVSKFAPIGLVGSAACFVAAFTALFRTRIAAGIFVVGALGFGLFCLGTSFEHQSGFSIASVLHSIVWLLFSAFPVMIGCSYYAWTALRRPPDSPVSPEYPQMAPRRSAIIACCVAVCLGGTFALMLRHLHVIRQRSFDVTWEAPSERPLQVTLRFAEAPDCMVEITSSELHWALISANRRTMILTVETISDFGRLRGWSVLGLGPWRLDGLGYSGTKIGEPFCTGNPSRASPIETDDNVKK